jgi:DNA-binding protein HU-beta
MPAEKTEMKNKAVIAKLVAQGMTKAEAERQLTNVITALSAAIAEEKFVALPGFGRFARKQRAARTGRNPHTGETLQIAAREVITFKEAAA